MPDSSTSSSPPRREPAGRFGLATSGTSIHRWVREGVPAHHLIDPRTARPAVTDIVQATVVASSAREAEIFAKAAVILGSDAALAALDRPGVLGAIVLTERGELAPDAWRRGARRMKFRGSIRGRSSSAGVWLRLASGSSWDRPAPTAIRSLADAWAVNRAILPWVVERGFGFLAYPRWPDRSSTGCSCRRSSSTSWRTGRSPSPSTRTWRAGLGLAAVHGALLALDRSVPFSLTQIAIPGLAPYQPLAVAAGQVALYLMAIVVGSFYVRRRIGQRAWRSSTT